MIVLADGFGSSSCLSLSLSRRTDRRASFSDWLAVGLEREKERFYACEVLCRCTGEAGNRLRKIMFLLGFQEGSTAITTVLLAESIRVSSLDSYI